MSPAGGTALPPAAGIRWTPIPPLLPAVTPFLPVGGPGQCRPPGCAHSSIFNVKAALRCYFIVPEPGECNDIQLDISELCLMDYLLELSVYFDPPRPLSLLLGFNVSKAEVRGR